MISRQPFRYIVLRYLHDQRTGEFVNLGVVVECASAAFLKGRFDSSFRRLTSFFPGVSARSLRSKVRDIERQVSQMSEDLRGAGPDIFDPKAHSIDSLWRRVLPCDDSALSWSNVRVGITSNPDDALEKLFASVVDLYKAPDEKGSRGDHEVWASVEPILRERGLQKHLESHEVVTSLSKYTFDHALKNGKWHCIEPVSVDLKGHESIRRKVQRIYGAMSLVAPSARDVKVYFVLSEPTTSAARELYKEAHGVISQAAVEHAVYGEREVSRLGDDLIEHFLTH